MQVSKFLRKSSVGYIHYCPACEEAHAYRTDGQGKANWTFNGNVEQPSFTPSMRISWGNKVAGYEEKFKTGTVCHYFIVTGDAVRQSGRMPDADSTRSYIDFCGDSTHAMAGQVVPLPELPGWMAGDGYGDGNP